MEILMVILEILKYTVPSVIVFLTASHLIKQMLKAQERKSLIEYRKQTSKEVNPIRLQAYERAILFLERITPSNLVIRVHQNRMNSAEMHTELLSTIRAEFDHNLTQQIYMSSGAWEALRRAKEETIKIINISASKVDGGAPGINLSKSVLDMCMQVEKLPTQMAIDAIKEEVKQLF